MSTDLFQALTLGLLVIVILALLVTVSMLGKIRASLEGRAPRTKPSDSGAGTAAVATVDEAVAGVSGAEPVGAVASAEGPSSGSGTEVEAAPAGEEVARPDAGEATGEDSERPFERGGRWYFRRSGELLVYEEGTGEWVPAEAHAETAAVHRQTEAIDASNEPAAADGDHGGGNEDLAPETATHESLATEPSTSFAGQPLATAEEQVATLGDQTVDEGAVATGFEEPGAGAVDLDEAAAASEEPAARSAESFWKCASCGAINGSTATSCRMCFAARP